MFRAVGKSGAVGEPLDPGDVARMFKAMAASAGIAPKLVASISGHSSRVGAAQDQVRHGVELPAVMQAGGWSSPAMVARYSAKLEARRKAPLSWPCCRTARNPTSESMRLNRWNILRLHMIDGSTDSYLIWNLSLTALHRRVRRPFGMSMGLG